MIRFIVDTVSSEFDRNGNRSHFARITSTKTGRGVCLESDGVNNAVHVLRKAGIEWAEIHATDCTIPRKDWREAVKQCAGSVEREESRETILALENRRSRK